eukprot:767177-Hanusia_phi.AAC.5
MKQKKQATEANLAKELEDLAKENFDSLKMANMMKEKETEYLNAISAQEKEYQESLNKKKSEFERQIAKLEADEMELLETKRTEIQRKIELELAQEQEVLQKNKEQALRKRTSELEAELRNLETDTERKILELEERKRTTVEKLEREIRDTESRQAAQPPPSLQQPTVGIKCTLNVDYDHVETSEGAFAAALRADFAVAVDASDTRFEWCGMERGSVLAFLNILPDPSGGDKRSPVALAEELIRSKDNPRSKLKTSCSTAKAVEGIEIIDPLPRKHVSVQWKIFKQEEERWDHVGQQRQQELKVMEEEYQRRLSRLADLQKQLREEENLVEEAKRKKTSNEEESAPEGKRGHRSSGHMKVSTPEEHEKVRKLVKEMKGDIQKRLASLMSSREAYKKERKALERQRNSAEYSFKLTFLREVKAAINQQALSLNEDAARVKAAEKIYKSIVRGSEGEPSVGQELSSDSFGLSDVAGDLSDTTEASSISTASSCATINRVHSDLAEAFSAVHEVQEGLQGHGWLMVRQLQRRARHRRAASKSSAPVQKIFYPARPRDLRR